MKIAVSMITYNEESYIGRAVSSAGWADYLVIVDGGSEDATEEEVHETLDQISNPPELIWIESPWNKHFGDQRQVSLDNVPRDAEWWIRLDSDEVFSPEIKSGAREVFEFASENEFIALRIRQTNLINDRSHYSAALGGWETWPRAFRHLYTPVGASAMVWVDEVHEHVMMMTLQGRGDIPNGATVDWSAQVYHFGWLDKQRREDREDLYLEIGGIAEKGDLVEREHVIKPVPAAWLAAQGGK